MILKDGTRMMRWEDLKSKTDDLIKAAEELDSDKIQIRLKALLNALGHLYMYLKMMSSRLMI